MPSRKMSESSGELNPAPLVASVMSQGGAHKRGGFDPRTVPSVTAIAYLLWTRKKNGDG